MGNIQDFVDKHSDPVVGVLCHTCGTVIPDLRFPITCPACKIARYDELDTVEPIYARQTIRMTCSGCGKAFPVTGELIARIGSQEVDICCGHCGTQIAHYAAPRCYGPDDLEALSEGGLVRVHICTCCGDQFPVEWRVGDSASGKVVKCLCGEIQIARPNLPFALNASEEVR